MLKAIKYLLGKYAGTEIIVRLKDEKGTKTIRLEFMN